MHLGQGMGSFQEPEDRHLIWKLSCSLSFSNLDFKKNNDPGFETENLNRDGYQCPSAQR